MAAEVARLLRLFAGMGRHDLPPSSETIVVRVSSRHGNGAKNIRCVRHEVLDLRSRNSARVIAVTGGDRLLISKAATEALWQGIAGDAAQWLAANFPGSMTECIDGKTEGLLPE